MADRRKLTQKQRLAVEAYMRLGDMTAAYREAFNVKGKSPNAARVRASELFAMPHVAAYLVELQDAAADDTILTQREGLQILTRIARGSLPAYLTEDGEIDGARVARGGVDIESYSTQHGEDGTTRKLKVRNPVQAIERIAKMLGWDKPTQVEAGGVVFNLQMGEDA